MIKAYRIVKERFAGQAFDGEGTRRFGGRWNNKYIPLVYTSSTLSLAALESLVHLNPPLFYSFVWFKIEIQENLVEAFDPEGVWPDWRQEPPSVSTKAFGDRWYHEKRTAVLKVPSAVVPEDSNYLLNGQHPDFERIIIHPPEPFVFDSRLFGLKLPGA